MPTSVPPKQTGLVDRITGLPVNIHIEPDVPLAGTVVYELRIGSAYAARCLNAGRATLALCKIEEALCYATGREHSR